MRKVNTARSDMKIFFPEVWGDTRSLPPTPRLAPLARLFSRGLLVRIPASTLARIEVGKVTFAKVKPPLDPRTKCSLRDALLHSGAASSEPRTSALARAFLRFSHNLWKARGRHDRSRLGDRNHQE